ncbi:hypothetical protein [Saccharomonospora xinjiangensis]|uniref:Secreted protein n=1 Tax=Saccharomonospora xinjiangensis XJ-54 TaxID=882086 RepID=I0V0L1_9PSEU|nr:hypothetical protein [Saccharomonospora xinjiangensis]EID53664.1 hypothetical protein SacxiDRAFT_1413 [Saccharomonospora xinjiangensis XJ-54]
MTTGAVPPPRVLVTVAVALAAALGAQVAAALWGSTAPDPVPVQPVRSADDVGCGAEPCRVLVSTVVNGMPVELLADRDGDNGRLRAGPPSGGSATVTELSARGVRLHHNSLRCSQSAAPVCLVRGSLDGGVVGEVHAWRGDAWHAVGGALFADAVVLDDVVLDDVVDGSGADGADGADHDLRAADVPEVVLVHQACADPVGRSVNAGCSDPGVVAEVVRLGGERVGCTRVESSPDDLRGWPEVDVRDTDLTECPGVLPPR